MASSTRSTHCTFPFPIQTLQTSSVLCILWLLRISIQPSAGVTSRVQLAVCSVTWYLVRRSPGSLARWSVVCVSQHFSCCVFQLSRQLFRREGLGSRSENIARVTRGSTGPILKARGEKKNRSLNWFILIPFLVPYENVSVCFEMLENLIEIFIFGGLTGRWLSLRFYVHEYLRTDFPLYAE